MFAFRCGLLSHRWRSSLTARVNEAHNRVHLTADFYARYREPSSRVVTLSSLKEPPIDFTVQALCSVSLPMRLA